MRIGNCGYNARVFVRSLILSLTAAALLMGVACAPPRSERCAAICAREALCVEELDDKSHNFDERECVAACTALERDVDQKKRVEAHQACVNAAATCPDVIDCM